MDRALSYFDKLGNWNSFYITEVPMSDDRRCWLSTKRTENICNRQSCLCEWPEHMKLNRN